jgi:hypothetical protein
METIVLTFKYTQNEFVKAMRQYLIANGTIRKYDPAIIAVFLLFSVLSTSSIINIILLVVTTIFSAFVIYLYFCLPVLTFKQNLKYHEEYTLTFSKAEIIFKTPSIDSVLQWSIYSEFWESDDFYFLIQTPQLYSIIPKRAFINSTDRKTFEEIVMTTIKKVKRKL